MRFNLYLLGIIIALVGASFWQNRIIKSIKIDRDSYKSNTESLLIDVQRYKTKDSLNAISVGTLSLKIEEFRKYRADDLSLINTLKLKNRDLERITSSQLKTIYEIKGTVRDSIVYRDNIIVDTLRCVTIKDKWFDLAGCINKENLFEGKFTSRDSLIYVETVKYKRFLGFLWKTNKVIDRKQDILSKNPNTEITGAEFITIRK